jgi:hypothetical protein
MDRHVELASGGQATPVDRLIGVRIFPKMAIGANKIDS